MTGTFSQTLSVYLYGNICYNRFYQFLWSFDPDTSNMLLSKQNMNSIQIHLIRKKSTPCNFLSHIKTEHYCQQDFSLAWVKNLTPIVALVLMFTFAEWTGSCLQQTNVIISNELFWNLIYSKFKNYNRNTNKN